MAAVVMKKGLLVLPLAAAMLFAGCSTSSAPAVSMGVAVVSEASAQTEVDVKALADALNTGGEFGEELTALDEAGLGRVYRTDTEAFEEAAGYTGSGATVDQISVWKAKDEAGAQELEDMLSRYLETQIDSYATYMPDEVPKLENAVLERSGVYVVLCVSEDAAKASDIISSYI